MKTRLTYALAILAGIILSLSSCSKMATSSAEPSGKMPKAASIEAGKKSSEKSTVFSQVDEEQPAPALEAEQRTVNALSPEKNPSVDSKAESGKGLSLAEKLVYKKIEKLSKKHSLSEKLRTAQVDQNLKIALILLVVALILMILPPPFDLIGYILLIIALVFVLLWLLSM